MSTVSAIFVFIVLISWCGIGPVLLLLPPNPCRYRILLLPFVGLCSHILFSMALASSTLTGQTTQLLSLWLLSALAVYGLYRSPISFQELRQAWPPLLIGVMGTVFIAWPLLRAGLHSYWGYANPDQAYLIQVLPWIRHHPFSVPPTFQHAAGYFRGVPENTILGIFYVVLTVATLVRTTPDLLFNVAEAGLVFLVPIAAFLFASALGLPRRRSLIVSASIACSSLVTYTFCLGSLGTLSVIAVIPVALALLLSFGEGGSMSYAALFAVVSAAMYYTYLGSIALLAVELPAIWLWVLIFRKVSVRRLLALPLIAVGITALAFPPFAYSTLRIFLDQSFSTQASPVAASPEQAELLLTFASPLSEEGVPFFWGLEVPHVPVLRQSGNDGVLGPYLFAAGFLCFALLALAFWPRVSRLAGSFPWIAGAALLPIAVYAYRTIGYGVFKLVPWVCPIMITGLVAALCGLADILRRARFPRLAALPCLALAIYIGVNAELSYRLGAYTQPASQLGSPQGLPEVPFEDVHQLTELAVDRYREEIAIMLPDVVAQRWAEAYLASDAPHSFPWLQLFTADSAPRDSRPPLPQTYSLEWNRRDIDIVEPPRTSAIWSNASFTLSRLDRVSNALIPGDGWYRVEHFPSAPVFWQQRLRWVRKRAELLLMNPLPKLQRLLLTMTAGYGNPAPERHVSFFLNGKKFDEVCFRGYTRMLTKPFQATPPWSQVEFEIAENASPLPRRHQLWAAWVPREPRKLNMAVSEVALLDSSAIAAASYLDLEAEMKRPHGFLESIYPDRWMGSGAAVDLQPCPDAWHVQLSGVLLRAPGFSVPYHIGLAVDDRLIGTAVIDKFGLFKVLAPIAPAFAASHLGQTVRLVLAPESTFVGQNGDPRRLSVRLDGVGFR